MDPITQQTALAAAGAAGAGDPVYVDDVFSTYLYDGTGSSQTITNEIDLAGEGGLVWLKQRNTAASPYTNLEFHSLHDSARGSTQYRLRTDSTQTEQQYSSGYVSSFNSNGFTLDNGLVNNTTADEYVSWTFRKAQKFFDVVTYTGNGVSGRQIAHNLGSVPGMIIVKCTSHTENWCVYHRSMGATKSIALNSDGISDTSTNKWNDTEPTSTHFTVGNGGQVNDVSTSPPRTYVAYLFAHDDQSFGTNGDESIIKCDSYVGAGHNNLKEVNVGFEPQWLLIKKTDGVENWMLFDAMRGIHAAGASEDHWLAPNNIYDEAVSADRVRLTPTGFELYTGNMSNELNKTFIYVAIRRPHKPPTAGTDVFAIDTLGGTSPSPPGFTSGFVTDSTIRMSRTGGNSIFASRLLGNKTVAPSSDAVQDTSTVWLWDYMNGVYNSSSTDNDLHGYMLRRVPGFFDVVTYDGNTTSPRQITHGLGVAPELVIIKNRDLDASWPVWSAYGDYPSNEHVHGFLGSSNGSIDWGNYGGFSNAVDQSTLFTDSIFTVTTSNNWANGSGDKFIAFLFASLDNISKIGRYDGNGTSKVIDCGFQSGARFVMIKCLTTGNNWRVFDTTRGINASANDPVFSLNTGQHDPNQDWLQPDNSGFKVNTSNDNVNGNNQKYLFLAIA